MEVGVKVAVSLTEGALVVGVTFPNEPRISHSPVTGRLPGGDTQGFPRPRSLSLLPRSFPGPSPADPWCSP